MKPTLPAAFLAALSVLASVSAAPINFNFKDPKGVNNVVFMIDAPLESTNGTASGISGKANFDPADPASVKGTITLDVASLRVSNSMMQDHLLGEQWMNVESFPTISFEITGTSNVRTSGDTTDADVSGDLTIKGTTKAVTVPVKMTFLKGKLKERGGSRVNGDLLVVRSSFSIKRSDYGINPGRMLDKVSDEIGLKLSIVGIAPYSQ